MLRVAAWASIIFVCGSPFLFSSAPTDYFPLQSGNQWICRVSGSAHAEPVVISIRKVEEFDGELYYLLVGPGIASNWLRMDKDGTLFSYDPETRGETEWAEFAAVEGHTYKTTIHPCSPTARVESRKAQLKAPAGEFSDVINSLLKRERRTLKHGYDRRGSY